ncbi:MAG: ImmA/IrrE family metallo-endopeptidase [Chloroflexi bacterium]|nr:ImmA/IrrE family metallo-endopeptidase [Chloroflexota bacterium]
MDNYESLRMVRARLTSAYSSTSPEEAIRQAAAEMLFSRGEPRLPVELTPIVRELGVKRIRKHYAPSQLQTSCLIEVTGGYEILLSRQDSRHWRRGRFTVAHEIGHLLLQRIINHPALLVAINQSTDLFNEVEELCDIAAGELLMPTAQFAQSLLSAPFSAPLLRLLYDRFLVSWRALYQRIPQLIPDSAVIIWKKDRSQNSTSVYRVNGSYPHYDKNSSVPWLPSRATIGKSMLIDVASRIGENPNGMFFESVKLIRGRKNMHCEILGCALPVKQPSPTLPSFGKLEVPDEPYRGDVITVLRNRNSEETSIIWDQIREMLI